MSIMTVITCISMMLSLAGFLQTAGWRGIVPLHSTREDVEHLLGAPQESHGVSSTYIRDDEKILVFYSAGPCKKGSSEEWNVPRDTVVSITVYPKAKMLVSNLRLDRTKYKRVTDPHSDLVVYYFNKEDGIRISARQLEEGEDVDSITYEPAARDSSLRCLDSPKTTELYGAWG